MTRLNDLVYNNNPLKGSTDATGIYRARVEDVKDPFGIGRVKVRVPKFHGLEEKGGYSVESLPWATMVSNSAGFNYGSFIVPEVGEYVMVQFEDEDPQKPIYFGSLFGLGARKSKRYESANEEWFSETRANEVPWSAQRENPTKKILYRSPKGAEVSIDEELGAENISITDTLGQSIVLNSPNSEESTHEERLTNGQANVTITGLNGQLIDINSTEESTEISVICRECALTLKPDSEGVSIFSNNACITLDIEGNIQISGGSVSITTNEGIGIQSEGEIGIIGSHVTIGNSVTIIEGGGGGSGSDYEGLDRDPNLIDISEAIKDIDVSDWNEVVALVKASMSAESGVYDQGGSVRCKIGDRILNIRTDCSGFVSGCLNIYGALNGMVSSSWLCSNTVKGFTKANFTSWSDLKKGDILVVNGHTEIYAGEKNGKHLVYNYGSNSSASNSGTTYSSKDRYTYVFRPDGSLST